MPRQPGIKRLRAKLDMMEKLKNPTLEDVKEVYDLLSKQKDAQLQMNCSMEVVWPKLSATETARVIFFFGEKYNSECVAFDRHPFEGIEFWKSSQAQLGVYAMLLDSIWLKRICTRAVKEIEFGELDQTLRFEVMLKIFELKKSK